MAANWNLAEVGGGSTWSPLTTPCQSWLTATAMALGSSYQADALYRSDIPSLESYQPSSLAICRTNRTLPPNNSSARLEDKVITPPSRTRSPESQEHPRGLTPQSVA
ncbi:hypothetical protein BGW80DRAFT_1445044 [Lactifluus volemus]|nr:hypothetical protein BGW80DRAFT_1445044 [Lactifluus volemus]